MRKNKSVNTARKKKSNNEKKEGKQVEWIKTNYQINLIYLVYYKKTRFNIKLELDKASTPAGTTSGRNMRNFVFSVPFSTTSSITLTTSSIICLVPDANFSHSKTPTGPFQTINLALAIAVLNSLTLSGPQSKP
ncbi:phosphoglycerate [Brachionus plicatilis]|uniref:Phosphoglycerate n=1 Tax=Brachionus plicatilis TaxID=10195 RepID=A0A3M7RGN9_BRAPC|nr:phosphoglycerate [Brachionus plicatilis]